MLRDQIILMVTREETVRAMKYIKLGKASGLSEVNTEMMIASGKIGIAAGTLSTHSRWK